MLLFSRYTTFKPHLSKLKATMAINQKSGNTSLKKLDKNVTSTSFFLEDLPLSVFFKDSLINM